MFDDADAIVKDWSCLLLELPWLVSQSSVDQDGDDDGAQAVTKRVLACLCVQTFRQARTILELLPKRRQHAT